MAEVGDNGHDIGDTRSQISPITDFVGDRRLKSGTVLSSTVRVKETKMDLPGQDNKHAVFK
jgi:hypothetical protein